MALAKTPPIPLISSTFLKFEEFKKKEAEAKEQRDYKAKEKVDESSLKRKEPSFCFMVALERDAQPRISYMISMYQDAEDP